MSPLEKMWASFVAIGLMAFSTFLISYARSRTTGVVRIILATIAFLMLLVAIMYMLLSLL
jgi:hypothetical protein